MNPAPVDDAIAVYRELGWDRLTTQESATADLGTPEQQRRAQAGCRTGTWASYGRLPSGHWGVINHLGNVDLTRFVVFAIRMCVDARRAASILALAEVPHDVLFSLLLERGSTFSAQFVERVSTSRHRWNVWVPTRWGTVTVRVVAALELEIPNNFEYLQDWAGCTARAIPGCDTAAPATPAQQTVPSTGPELARFAEHVRAAVAAGLQLTGPLLPACQFGLRNGVLDRNELVGLSFAGLDRARRPGERAAWVNFLTDDLGLTDAEILERAEELIPALATGSREVVEKLGVVLLSQAPEDLLPDLVASALPAAASRRLRTLIVDTLAARTTPEPAVVQDIADVLAGLDDSAIVPKSRATLITGWSMGAVESAPPPEIRAEWRPTPAVWSVPRFVLAPATADSLVEAVRDVVTMPATTSAWTVEAERLLALMVACAAIDVDATRAALRGVRDAPLPGFWRTAEWLRGESGGRTFYEGNLCGARESAVVDQLGVLPCLLSQPSWDDLRIDAADLANHLQQYAVAGVDACRADLLLALTRTDLATVTPQTQAAICSSPVGIRMKDGSRIAHRTKWWKRLGGSAAGAAGELARQWFSEPIPEPSIAGQGGSVGWRSVYPHIPQRLRDQFEEILDGRHRSSFSFWEFPTWGDAAMVCFGFDWQTDAGQGPLLRQLARRGSPLPPGAAINLLAAQRDPHPQAAADSQQAVLDAFDRGILRPGDADVRYLDWNYSPRNLAAFGRAMLELAEVGLLSVVWPVLDELIALSAGASTVISGTEVLADTMAALLPTALSAVEAGTADTSVLSVPGVRELAARRGSGVAVRTARQMVEALSGVAPQTSPPGTTPGLTFDEVWQHGVGTAPRIDDRAEISIGKNQHSWQRNALEVRVRYGDLPGRTFVVPSDAVVHLFRTGRLAATEEYPQRGQVALQWNPRPGRMESAQLDLLDPGSLLPSGSHPSLTDSMVAVVLAGIHDGDHQFGPHLLRRRQFGLEAVQRCLPILLAAPEVDPAELARILDAAPDTLPALWPLVTEPVRRAGELEDALPRWVSAVLGVALGVAPHLAEAARRGLVPLDVAGWPGVERIAERTGKSAAVVKARQLSELVRTQR